MAKIPSAEKMGRISPSGTASIARLDNSQTEGLNALGVGLNKIAQRKDEFETSKADLDFITLKNKQDQAAERDEDYSTLDERYTAGLKNGLSELALNISNPRARAKFVERHKFNVEKSRQRIQGIAWNKEVDHERAGVNDRLNKLREVVLTGNPEDVALAKESMTNLMNTAQKAGYYKETEIGNMKQAWKVDAAVARLEGMEPENQLEAFKQGWAKELPTDIKNKMKLKAKSAVRSNKAVTMVDDLINLDLDEEQAREHFQKIKDAKLRKEVESRFDYVYNKNKKADAEEQWQYKNDYAHDVLHGKVQVGDIPADEWDAMDSESKFYLENLQAESVKPATKSDPNAVLYLSELAAKERWPEIVAMVKDPKSALSAGDRVKYGNIAIDGTMPIEVDDGLTDVQAITSALVDANITDDEAKSRILHNVGEWRRRYIEVHNKKPDDNERNKFIDDQFLKGPSDIGMIWDTEVPLYEMGQDDFDTIMKEIREEAPEIAKKIEEYFTSPKSGKDISAQLPDDTKRIKANPTKADILKVYKILKGE